MNVSKAVRARSILFASLAVTLFAAFIAVLGKQWVLHYRRASTWGSIVDRGKERQVKFVGLQKWRLHYIMESLPVMLQLALLLFNVGLIVYLWDLDRSSADVMLAVTCTGFAFYTGITAVATIWNENCPFQTTLSRVLLRGLSLVKEIPAYVRARPRRQSTAFPPRTEWAEENTHLMAPLERSRKASVSEEAVPMQVARSVHDEDYMRLSNPTFWRQNPLFAPPLLMDTAASAGFWLIENSTDFSAASAVAAVFYEFQWPSHHHSTTALIRLHDTYTGRLRAPKADKLARLQALQSAAAYYVLYHSRLIWSIVKGCEADVEELPTSLPSDLLLLHKDSKEWQGFDLFEYLLHTGDRSVSAKWAQFLSYIAPYWFCGDSDSAIRFRSKRLQSLDELIDVLKSSNVLVPGTLTDCVLCVGAAMDFPLHPEDLIRVDKRCVLLLDTLRVVLIVDSEYFVLTFRMVVEHVQDVSLAKRRRYRYVAEALKILLTLVKNTTLPLVNAAWINDLLKCAANGDMADEEFILLLKLSALRKEEGTAVNTGVGDSPVQRAETGPQSPQRARTSGSPTPDDTLFRTVVKIIQTYGLQDEAVYGGLLAIRDIRELGPSLFDDDTLQTFHEVMASSNPLRFRQAAYDAVLVMQDQWLRSLKLRQRLEDLGFFGQLHSVVVEIARPDYQRSFLQMMEILSEEPYWHSCLRETMDIWLPFRREGALQTLRIIRNIGGLTSTTRYNTSSSSIDNSLQNLMVDEWAAIPGRHVRDLTADRLRPLAEITEGFKELLFDDSSRRAVLAEVEQVIPGLERRNDTGDDGPGEDVCDIVDALVAKLRLPTRRLTYD